MATRRQIADDIKQTYGACLNVTQASEYLGMCRDKVRQFLSDIPHYDTGRQKKYLAVDIARKLDGLRRGT